MSLARVSKATAAGTENRSSSGTHWIPNTDTDSVCHTVWGGFLLFVFLDLKLCLGKVEVQKSTDDSPHLCNHQSLMWNSETEDEFTNDAHIQTWELVENS